jgi:signal transduction histidine kinase
MKSIKTKLIVFLGLLIVVICIGLGTASFINSSKALNSNLGKTLPTIAEELASSVQGRIEGQLNLLESIAARNEIKDPNNSLENKIQLLLAEAKRNGSINMAIIDKDGNSVNTQGQGVNITDRVFFQNALSGKSNTSDPIVSKTSGAVVVVNAVPIIYNNKVVGVLSETKDGNYLSELTNQVKLGQTGYAFMIRKDGTNIGSVNKNFVVGMYNPIEAAKKDNKLLAIADIEKKMGAGETGIGEYNFEGIDKYVGYAPIKGTEWSVGVILLKNEVLSELNSLKISVIYTSVLFIIIGLAIVYIIANRISKGIKSTSKHLDLLAKGNLSEEISPKYLKLKDEVGEMTNSMKIMQRSLYEVVKSKESIITQKKHQIEESEINDKLKTEFISNISHELKTPLNIIVSAIQLLSLYERDGSAFEAREGYKKYLNVMKQNSYRLIRLVNNIIDISKIDSGYMQLNLENHNIVAVVEDITLSVVSFINDKDISLTFDTDVEEKILACDTDKIERIILNLLSNAVKFSNPGSSILVYINDRGSEVVISVEDTGIGMEKDKLDLIFNRFAQLDKSFTRNHEGSGIGLSLVESLVEMHGGKIKVESEFKKGSKFIITLPSRTLEVNDKKFEKREINATNVETVRIEFSDIYS